MSWERIWVVVHGEVDDGGEHLTTAGAEQMRRLGEVLPFFGETVIGPRPYLRESADLLRVPGPYRVQGGTTPEEVQSLLLSCKTGTIVVRGRTMITVIAKILGHDVTVDDIKARAYWVTHDGEMLLSLTHPVVPASVRPIFFPGT